MRALDAKTMNDRLEYRWDPVKGSKQVLVSHASRAPLLCSAFLGSNLTGAEVGEGGVGEAPRPTSRPIPTHLVPSHLLALVRQWQKAGTRVELANWHSIFHHFAISHGRTCSRQRASSRQLPSSSCHAHRPRALCPSRAGRQQHRPSQYSRRELATEFPK